jgi:hypothetical protein
MPPVPFAPDEVCEVMPPVSRDAEGRWQDPRGVIAEGRIFTLNADGTRRQSLDHHQRPALRRRPPVRRRRRHRSRQIHRRTAWCRRVPADDRTDWTPGEAAWRTLVPSPCPPGLDGHWLGTDESGHDVVARLFGGFRHRCSSRPSSSSPASTASAWRSAPRWATSAAGSTSSCSA